MCVYNDATFTVILLPTISEDDSTNYELVWPLLNWLVQSYETRIYFVTRHG